MQKNGEKDPEVVNRNTGIDQNKKSVTAKAKNVKNDEKNPEVEENIEKDPEVDESKKHRLFVFTYYPPSSYTTEEQKEQLAKQQFPNRPEEPLFKALFTWMYYGYETCPKTNMKHLQGVVYVENKTTIKSLNKHLFGAHVAVARESALVNKKYCGKGEQPHDEWELMMDKGINWGKNAKTKEYGNMPSQGLRTDLKNTTDKILKGELKVIDILKNQPMDYHMYGRTFEKIQSVYYSTQVKDFMTKGIWYFGKTGCGKSHIALNDLYEKYKLTKIKNFYECPDDGDWYDNYQQEEYFIINEFRGGITMKKLLMMVDKWGCDMNRRNLPPIPFMSKTVIITSALKPEEVYHNLAENDDLLQIYRRFEVIEIINPNKENEIKKKIGKIINNRK